MMSDLSFLTGEEKQEGYSLVDLSQIALATAMHTLKPGEKISLGLLRHIVLSSIKHNVLKFKKDGYSNVIIAMDNPTPSYWRREEAYYYKKNRQKSRDKIDFDWEGFFNSMKIISQEIKDNLPYIVSDIPKGEADDTIGVLAKYLSNAGHKVLIISSDGDFTQLQKYKNIKQWSAIQKKYVEVKGESPEYDLMVKILKGDKKDGIAGIKVRSDYWYTHIEGERTPIIKTAFVKEMAESDDPISLLSNEQEKERFLENKKLLDLDLVREDITKQILDNYNTYKVKGRSRIYSYFVKSGLTKLLKDVGDF